MCLLSFSDEKTLYLTPEQEKDKSHFTDKEVGTAYASAYTLCVCGVYFIFFLFCLGSIDFHSFLSFVSRQGRSMS